MTENKASNFALLLGNHTYRNDNRKVGAVTVFKSFGSIKHKIVLAFRRVPIINREWVRVKGNDSFGRSVALVVLVTRTDVTCLQYNNSPKPSAR